jgi:ABC-2 type transport system permease protein
VSTAAASTLRRRRGPLAEVRKLGAFLRREWLVASSDRLAHISDAAAVGVGVVMFALVGRMVDPAVLPVIAGERTTYMEFAAVGIVLGAFIQVSMARVARAIEDEQSRGTLESLLATPTATSTIFLGSVIYDFVYVPVRTGLFLIAIVLMFGLDYRLEGALPAALYLLAFLPFVWGLGMVSAAITLTFRRGAGLFTIAVTMFTVGAGIYFPLAVLPQPAEAIAPYNPIWVAATGMREAFLTGSWGFLDPKILALPLFSVLALSLGVLAIRLALRREREHGSLALY